jgi:hypothetical protein
MALSAKRLLFAAVLASLPLVVLALIEGAASYAFFARNLLRSRPVAERAHTEPDTLLGWINQANLSLPDFYGPGIGFHTNSQRLRHDGNLTPRAPAGKRRLLCSGDSFTLGYGVDEAHTWCALAGAAESLETVNMGQGGYGIDQAYLWYLRDGLPLHPDIHIFAFITPDYTRMQSDAFLGYPKPRLVRASDGVRATGVPVPGPGMRPRMFELTRAVHSLKTYDALSSLMPHRPDSARAHTLDRATWDVAAAALRDLAGRDRAAGTRFLVVHLPTDTDYRSQVSDQWRQWEREEAGRGTFVYLDLITAFRRLPPDSLQALFIARDALPYLSAEGHYTAAGNAWIAAQLRPYVVGSAVR